MAATEEQLREVCTLLHSRGREATPEQVQEFLDKFQARQRKGGRPYYPDSIICKAIMANEKMITVIMHLHFGDAL